MGGSAILLLGYSDRVTLDIDVLRTDLPGEFFRLVEEKYDINKNVAAFTQCFEKNYESRRKPVDLDTKKIDFFTVSLEDSVIAKLAAGRKKDLLDVCRREVWHDLDGTLLDQLEREVAYGMMSDYKRREFEDNYRDFLEEKEACGCETADV